ncbi:MAG: HAD family hydrolase [Patescibacteria group bacterium]|jgi:putative hydrolase of the HAD superfamily
MLNNGKNIKINVKAVILDLDNTLYAYAPCNLAGQQAVIHWLNKKTQVTPLLLKQYYTKARKQIHKQLNGQAASHSRLLYLQHVIEQVYQQTRPQLTLQAEQVFWRAYFKTMKLRPDIITLLNYLQQHHLKLAILSDLTTSLQLNKIKQLKLSSYFTYIVTSEEAGHEKPALHGMKLLLQKMRLHPSQVLYIGDSIKRDATVAKKMRIPFILLKSNNDIGKISRFLSKYLC